MAHIIWATIIEPSILYECDLFWPSLRYVFKSGSLVLSQYCWDDPKAKQNDSTHFKSSSWTFAKWLMLHDSCSTTWKGFESRLVDSQKSVAWTSGIQDLFNNFRKIFKVSKIEKKCHFNKMGVCHKNNQFLQWNPIFVFRLLQVFFFSPSLHMLAYPMNVSDLNRTLVDCWLMLVTDVEHETYCWQGLSPTGCHQHKYVR